MDKEEAKKIADYFYRVGQGNHQPFGIAFNKYWQETHPEKLGDFTLEEWERIAKLGDVLVEVVDSKEKRYLMNVIKDHVNGKEYFALYNNGATSKTNWRDSNTVSFNCRLIEDTRWRKNTGEQPLPDCVEVGYIMRNGSEGTMSVDEIDWRLTGADWNVLMYKIIGTEPTNNTGEG